MGFINQQTSLGAPHCIYIYTSYYALRQPIVKPIYHGIPNFQHRERHMFGTRGDGLEIPGGFAWVQEPWFVWEFMGF